MPVPFWIDGFDTYKDASDLGRNNYSIVNNAVIDTVHPRTGTSAIVAANNNGLGVCRTIPASNIVACGMAIYPTLSSAYHGCMFVGTGGTDCNALLGSGGSNNNGLQLTMGDNGSVKFTQGNNPGSGYTTRFETAAGIVPLNTYSYLELLINKTTGTAAVWFNGLINLFNVSGLVIPSQFTQVAWGQPNAIGAGVYIDDVYANDGTLLGAQRCYTLYANADQLPQDWTLSSGASAFALIDQQAYNTANFIEAAAVGNLAKFACQDLPMTSAIINAIRLNSVQELSTAGSGSVVQKAFIGTGEYDGAPSAPSTTPEYFNDLFAPHGVSVADINAMSIELDRTV